MPRRRHDATEQVVLKLLHSCVYLSIASWLSLRFLASVLLYSLINSRKVFGVVYTWRRSVS
jgi:hypothetical protein